MPKFKKKKSAVGADFKRVRTKVGKKLPKAQNATDTSFRSKQIVLGEQNIGQDKGSAVTASNLSLKDLLTQLSHFSDKVRRGAAEELRGFLVRYPEQLRRHVALCIERVAERLNDGDKEVRENILAMLEEPILTTLPVDTLAPFAPTIVAQVGRALTSLNAGARRHALRAVALLAVRAPRLLVGSGAGAMSHAHTHAEILEHFSILLSTSNKVASVAVAASSSSAAAATRVAASAPAKQGGSQKAGRAHVSPIEDRYLICSSFLSFLLAIAPDSVASYLRPATLLESASLVRDRPARTLWTHRQHDAVRSQLASLTQAAVRRAPPGPGHHGRMPRDIPPDGATMEDSKARTLTRFWKGLLLEFAPLLLENYRACVPTSFVTLADISSVRCMLTSVLALRTLLRAYLVARQDMGTQPVNNAEAEEADFRELADCLWRGLGPYFPLRTPDLGSSLMPADNIQALNGATCECLSNVFALLPDAAHGQQLRRVVLQSVVEWLGDERTIRKSVSVAQGLSAHGSQQVAEGKREAVSGACTIAESYSGLTVFSSLLASMRNVLPHITSPGRVALLRALRLACYALPTELPEKAEFLVTLTDFPDLLRLVENRVEPGRAAVEEDEPGGMSEEVAGWIRELPRMLWEVKTCNTRLTRACLQLLLEAGRQASPHSELQRILRAASGELSHFFGSVLQSEEDSCSRMVYGPYLKLDGDLQELAACAIAQIGYPRGGYGDEDAQDQGDQSLLQALALCCLSCALSPRISIDIVDSVMAFPDPHASAVPAAENQQGLRRILRFGLTILRGRRPSRLPSGAAGSSRWLRETKQERALSEEEALLRRRRVVRTACRHLSNLTQHLGTATVMASLEASLVGMLEPSSLKSAAVHGLTLHMGQDVIEEQRNALQLLCDVLLPHITRGAEEVGLRDVLSAELLRATATGMLHEFRRQSTHPYDEKNSDGDVARQCVRALCGSSAMTVLLIRAMADTVTGDDAPHAMHAVLPLATFLMERTELHARLQDPECVDEFSGFLERVKSAARPEHMPRTTALVATAHNLGISSLKA